MCKEVQLTRKKKSCRVTSVTHGSPSPSKGWGLTASLHSTVTDGGSAVSDAFVRSWLGSTTTGSALFRLLQLHY